MLNFRQARCLAEAKGIYQARTKLAAAARFRDWAMHWCREARKPVACIEQDLEDLLAFLDCPPTHWRKCAPPMASNGHSWEVRRRTKPMICFQNAASEDRIIYGVISRLNKAWKEKPLPQLTHKA